MIWIESDADELERQIIKELSLDNTWKHIEWLAKVGERLGGSPEAEKTVQYIAETLRSYGTKVDVYQFDAFVSFPQKSELEVRSPEQKAIECAAYAFSATTQSEGIEGELVDVKSGAEEVYKQVDVKGKIVLTEQSNAPIMTEKVRLAQKYGSAALVIMNWGKAEEASEQAVGMGVASWVWGNPTHESIKDLPRIPAITIRKIDGVYLKKLCQRGPVRIWLRAAASREWLKASEPIALIKGAKEPKHEVLLSGHLDAWGGGVTDNAVGVACLLELARVFSKHKARLRRSLRIAWWNAHENLYDGSTWYLDNFWDKLDGSLVAHYNCDSVGMRGTRDWNSNNSIEIRKFEEQTIKDVLGESVTSLPQFRSGDNSFIGMGVPYVFGYTDFPPEVVEEMGGGWYAGWWYQSVKDTIDKVDKNLLLRALKAYAASLVRLCTVPILPLEYVGLADEAITTLKELQEKAGGKFDLSDVISKAKEFKTAATKLEATARNVVSDYAATKKRKGERGKKDYEEIFGKLNQRLLTLNRILVPALYSVEGRYGQDPPLDHQTPIPLLNLVSELATMNTQSSDFKALTTHLVRQRNKVSDALKNATTIAMETIRENESGH